MASPVPLRPDFDAAALRTLVKSSPDPDQTRRLLALSAIYGAVCAPRRPLSVGLGFRPCGTGCSP